MTLIQIEMIRKILSVTTAKSIKMAAARGTFPLPANELLFLLVQLAGDSDSEISDQAAATIRETPEDELLGTIRSDTCDPSVLEFLTTATPSPAVLEALILNPRTPGHAIARLALSARSNLLELILENRMRLLEFPEILFSIKNNTQSSPSIRQMIQDIESEFVGTTKSVYAVEPDAKLHDPAESGDGERIDEGEDFSLEGLPLDPEEREQALFIRLSHMSVRDKLKRAMLGTREERVILIRDTNRQIAKAVLQSPKLSENEIETFAAMRNISDEVLREIGNSREWTKRYGVAQNLVRNPKTPAFISQRLLLRLHSRDLALISRDRGVPEPVRRGAQQTLLRRSHQK